MGKRTEPKTNAMRMLERAGIAYRAVSFQYDDRNFDGRLVAVQVEMPPEQVLKTLVTVSPGGSVVVCCVPVWGQLDLKALAAAAGCKRLELAPLGKIQALTGYVRGGVSPVGMKKEYPTFVDESAMQYSEIAVSGGMRGLQLLLDPRLLIEFTGAEVGCYCSREGWKG